ncbi:dienelactone hydrolase family protein [Cupriavidus pampae]|uniref:Xaa-Pro dipeptidyl-peptidase-like domain-containing protein n=1 Tax=Cupriavidus pampae TaxID=659251 RepID=A0ABN7YSS3_9BURK|nr:hypothetical protein LMG32289_03429 [Cupriavidus pampae]
MSFVFRALAWLMLGPVAMPLMASSALAQAQSPSPLPPRVTEQVVMIPKTGTLFTVELETTIFRPPGDGPFPLVVINHGKAPGKPAFQGRAKFVAQSAEFLKRGYVVALPMRQGFSRSGGAYIGGGCNVQANGLMQAEDLIAALDYLTRQSYVDAERIVMVGQSHGGLSTMAFNAIGYPGVRGVINFAGGLRNESCAGWENNLVDAFADYGRTARYPSLWIYGSNDSYWPWPLPETMFNRYKAAATGSAADATFVDVGEFESDSHRLFSSRNGIRVWLPPVEAFLRRIGMPAE